MENEIMNAKDFCIKEFYGNESGFSFEDMHITFRTQVIEVMKSFAKLHVTKALQEAAENATGKPSYDFSNRYKVELITDSVDIDENSILNAYPLDNIK